jgi:hypothetical protein
MMIMLSTAAENLPNPRRTLESQSGRGARHQELDPVLVSLNTSAVTAEKIVVNIFCLVLRSSWFVMVTVLSRHVMLLRYLVSQSISRIISILREF